MGSMWAVWGGLKGALGFLLPYILGIWAYFRRPPIGMAEVW